MRKLIAGLVLIGALLLAGEWFLDAAFHPWAHSVLGSATLTGTWSGSFVDYDDVAKPVRLVLRRTMTPSGSYEDDGPPLSGEMVVGGRTAYSVSGRPGWWRGRTMSVQFDVTAPAAPRGYFLREATGEWRDGKLTLHAKAVYFEADGGMFASGGRYPLLQRVVVLTLIRE